MKRIRVAVILISLAFWASADTMVAYWDFGSNIEGYTETVTLENAVGTPTLTGMSVGTSYDSDGQIGVSFLDAVGGSHSDGQALAWGSGVDDGNQEWILGIDLTAYQDLTLRWDYRSSLGAGTGPTRADLAYKVGEGAWTAIESSIALTADSEYHEYSKDLSSISAIDGQSMVQLRLSNFSGATSTSGTYRTDNLQLSVVPEPAVMGLFGLGGMLVIIARHALRA